MERLTETQARASRPGSETPSPRDWNLIYFGVLAHLGLWIAALWLFSRWFGSVQ